MSPEKEKLLFDACPILFSGKGRPVTESLMGFGCEHDDGWFDLVMELSVKLEEINHSLPLGKEIKATQVKEKFGGLRFYVGAVPKEVSHEVFALIEIAEEKSLEICEVCGKPGGQCETKFQWIKTLCDEHLAPGSRHPLDRNQYRTLHDVMFDVEGEKKKKNRT